MQRVKWCAVHWQAGGEQGCSVLRGSVYTGTEGQGRGPFEHDLASTGQLFLQ